MSFRLAGMDDDDPADQSALCRHFQTPGAIGAGRMMVSATCDYFPAGGGRLPMQHAYNRRGITNGEVSDGLELVRSALVPTRKNR